MLDKKKLQEVHDYLRKHEWIVVYKHGVSTIHEDNISMRKCKSCGSVEYLMGETVDGSTLWGKRHPNENYHKNRTARFS